MKVQIKHCKLQWLSYLTLLPTIDQSESDTCALLFYLTGTETLCQKYKWKTKVLVSIMWLSELDVV